MVPILTTEPKLAAAIPDNVNPPCLHATSRTHQTVRLAASGSFTSSHAGLADTLVSVCPTPGHSVKHVTFQADTIPHLLGKTDPRTSTLCLGDHQKPKTRGGVTAQIAVSLPPLSVVVQYSTVIVGGDPKPRR